VNRKTILDAILSQRVIAIVRSPTSEHALDTVDRLVAAGVASIEISLVTPGALEAISIARQRYEGRAAIGVGTVVSVEEATAAVDVGAQFIVTPVTVSAVIRYSNDRELVVVPGASTPTEMVLAQREGADLVKVFPASTWSPAAIRDLRASLTTLQLAPTGGITLETAPDWIRAGAVAVGMGSALSQIADSPADVAAFLQSLQSPAAE
jgi:2-dehydro-3-deoxyphosphogluconate aldolase / (4S)-4-hydroxy-2-oxoglutarate aldolase